MQAGGSTYANFCVQTASPAHAFAGKLGGQCTCPRASRVSEHSAGQHSNLFLRAPHRLHYIQAPAPIRQLAPVPSPLPPFHERTCVRPPPLASKNLRRHPACTQHKHLTCSDRPRKQASKQASKQARKSLLKPDRLDFRTLPKEQALRNDGQTLNNIFTYASAARRASSCKGKHCADV
jgi:hypothetical protein